MIIGLDEIKRRNLVDNLCDRDKNNPEGTGVDLRAGKIFVLDGNETGFLHVETRKGPSLTLVGEYEEGKSKKIILEPGKTYVIQTIEYMRTPSDLVGRFYPRANLFLAGILVQGQKADPGYHGTVQFSLTNISGHPFELELGARIAMLMYHEVKGKTSEYRGQWKGGRPNIEKEEKQV